MPFTAELTALYETAIKPELERLGYDVRRADDLSNFQSIIRVVVVSIEQADLVVADLTGRNPNVMYEAEVAHSRGRPTLLLTQQIDDIPFDLRGYRAIRYDPARLDLSEFRELAARHLRPEVTFGSPVSDFVDVRERPPATPEQIAELQRRAVAAGRRLIDSMARLAERERPLADQMPPMIESALRQEAEAAATLGQFIRRYAREQAIDVKAFRGESDSYHGAVRELIEASDLSKAANADSARRLEASLMDTQRRTAGVVDGLRERRDQFQRIATDIPAVDAATTLARATYDDTLAALAIDDAGSQQIIEVIRERLARHGA